MERKRMNPPRPPYVCTNDSDQKVRGDEHSIHGSRRRKQEQKQPFIFKSTKSEGTH